MELHPVQWVSGRKSAFFYTLWCFQHAWFVLSNPFQGRDGFCCVISIILSRYAISYNPQKSIPPLKKFQCGNRTRDLLICSRHIAKLYTAAGIDCTYNTDILYRKSQWTWTESGFTRTLRSLRQLCMHQKPVYMRVLIQIFNPDSIFTSNVNAPTPDCIRKPNWLNPCLWGSGPEVSRTYI